GSELDPEVAGCAPPPRELPGGRGLRTLAPGPPDPAARAGHPLVEPQAVLDSHSERGGPTQQRGRCEAALDQDAAGRAAPDLHGAEVHPGTARGGVMPAAGRRVARVNGAGVLVVAVARRTARASAVAARVVHRAGVAIVAGGKIVGMGAPALWVASVVRTAVPVVAVEWRATHAGPAAAPIARRAGVVVVTGGSVGRVEATRDGTAGVIRADVAVVAIEPRAAHA